MRNRNATITLIFIILLLLFAVVRRWREPGRRELFDRDPAALTFTRHAKCRMACRQISAKEIGEVMEKGVIMLNRSNRNDRPCPTYALQARTSDNQYIRVILPSAT